MREQSHTYPYGEWVIDTRIVRYRNSISCKDVHLMPCPQLFHCCRVVTGLRLESESRRVPRRSVSAPAQSRTYDTQPHWTPGSKKQYTVCCPIFKITCVCVFVCNSLFVAVCLHHVSSQALWRLMAVLLDLRNSWQLDPKHSESV